jgi:hypothetical protein
MREFLVVGVFFFVWFWLSLDPGSRLGIAVTSADFMSVFRDLGRKEPRTRQSLRTAGKKALAIYGSFCVLGLLGAASRIDALRPALPGASGGICGLIVGYGLLHWSTRRGGWCGL